MNWKNKAMLLKVALSLITVFIISVNSTHAELRLSVSQFGITWTFSDSAECGQFINGDWWVVGPVTIASVSPGPRTALSTEVNDLGNNHWGDTGLQDDTTMRNGSMVVMTPGSTQGYDSRGKTYNASVSITFPYELDTCQSLISSISNDTIPNEQMFHEIMWASEKEGKQVMKTAAILTCLPEAPAADAFRPTYIGSDKPIFTYSQVQWDRLLNLEPTSSMPSWEQFERYFERPWLDHMNGAWQGQWLLPIENQASYGREGVRMISMASLMLHTDTTQEQKKKLLIGLIQTGIDLRGVAEVGGKWNEGGGHTSGRKWPILFAGLMLNDSSYFFNMPSTAIFHEDLQTYYGEGWAGQKALWQMIVHHGYRLPYMQMHPSLWSSYDAGWAKTSENYRTCCTIKAWPGQALAALLMGAKSVWNHNAFFDNVEDWMRQEDIYASDRDGYSRNSNETSSYSPYDDFVTEMWLAYRDSVPEQPDGDLNRMWKASQNKWVENDTLPPDQPFNLRVTGTTSTSAQLDWVSSDDDNKVLGYNVYTNGNWNKFVDKSETTMSGLRQEKLYKFTVIAIDEVGNKSVVSDTAEVIIQMPSGILNNENPSSIKIYANVLSGNGLIVDLGTENYETKKIEVIDLNGRTLYKKVTDDNKRIVEMNDCNLRYGVYLVRVGGNKSKAVTQKLIIQ